MLSARKKQRLYVTTKIEPANSDHADAIREILVQGFPRYLLPYTIYGCEQYTVFLQDQIEIQNIGHNTQFVTYCEDGKLLGYVELRSLPDALFLNNIAVLPEAQGRGIGKELLAEAIKITRAPAHYLFELDVFVSNLRAKNWYHRLGMRSVYEQFWLKIPLLATDLCFDGWWNTPDLGLANQVHKYYGFSQFALQFDSTRYKIGRISNNLYRITENNILSNKAAVSVLATLDSERQLLYIGGAIEGQLPESSTVLARSLHMQGELNTVLRNLC